MSKPSGSQVSFSLLFLAKSSCGPLAGGSYLVFVVNTYLTHKGNYTRTGSPSWCLCLNHCRKHLSPVHCVAWNPYTLNDGSHGHLLFMDVCHWLSSGAADRVGLFLSFFGEVRSTPRIYVYSSHKIIAITEEP